MSTHIERKVNEARQLDMSAIDYIKNSCCVYDQQDEMVCSILADQKIETDG